MRATIPAALLCVLGLSAPSASADWTFVARGTGYYPANNSIEGGFYDRMGKPLQTLQAYLAGKASYVSVAMDNKVFPYGQKLRIAELERKYGRTIEFRVVDTGGAFYGKGTSRIDICTANYSASLDPTINGYLHCTVITGSTSGGTTSSTNWVWYQVKVTADTLNVRTGPGTGYTKVGNLSSGQVVNVHGVSNGWFKIWYGGAWRWILGTYTARTVGSVKVTADTLNIRSGPGTGYALVGTLKSGAIVAVFGTSGSWLKIRFYDNGAWRDRWILGSYTSRI